MPAQKKWQWKWEFKFSVGEDSPVLRMDPESTTTGRAWKKNQKVESRLVMMLDESVGGFAVLTYKPLSGIPNHGSLDRREEESRWSSKSQARFENADDDV